MRTFWIVVAVIALLQIGHLLRLLEKQTEGEKQLGNAAIGPVTPVYRPAVMPYDRSTAFLSDAL